MWSIKFLSGPKAGKEIVLQPGLLLLGREASCQIQILSEVKINPTYILQNSDVSSLTPTLCQLKT